MAPTTLKANANDSGTMSRPSSNAEESYYGNVSYKEWCHMGTLGLLRFRRKQNQRRASIGGTTISKRESNDTSKSILKKRPPSGCLVAPPLKKQAVASSPMHDDTDWHSVSPSSILETAAMSSAASLDGSITISHAPEPLMDTEDDGNNLDVMDMDDDEIFPLPQKAIPAPVIASKMVMSNAESSPSLSVIPSPFFSFLNRWRPAGTKKPQVCFGRRQKTDPNSGVISFTVKETPPQCIALIEGICDSVQQNPTGDQNYYASPNYHYLSDLLDYGQHDLLPARGYATELPSSLPAYPGPWIAQILPSHPARLDPSLPTRQSDWNGSRIRLVHQEYERLLPPCTEGTLNDGCTDPGISVVRIDPSMRRTFLQPQDDHTDSLLIGAMGVILFDGFGSTAESSALQGRLAEFILKKLHHSLVVKEGTASRMLYSTILGMDAFTTKRGLTLRPTESVSGGGGVVLPVSIACWDGTTRSSRDDYHLLLYSCETVNSVVAIEIVFDEAPVSPDEENHMKVSSSSTCFDEHQGLTQKQLDRHASTWSALNILHLWKQHQVTPVQTAPAPEETNDVPLTSDEATCFNLLQKSEGSDAMSVVFTAREQEEDNPTGAMSPNLPASPSTFASANSPTIEALEHVVLHTGTKNSTVEMCFDTLPVNNESAAINSAFMECEEEQSPAAAMKPDLPKCHSTFLSLDSPTIIPPQQTLYSLVQGGVSTTVEKCLNNVSVASTVMPAPGHRSDAPLKSLLSKPYNHSLNHVTPTPFRPQYVLPKSQESGVSRHRGSDAKVVMGKHLFPETEVKQRMSVPVVSTVAVSGVVASEEQHGLKLEGSANATSEFASPDIIVPKDSEEAWLSWLSVFFGLHDEHEFPEMSRDELVGWMQNRSCDDVALAPVCLHDALFGWALDDFSHDDDAAVPWFFYNWLIPIVTWVATLLLIWFLHASLEETTLVPLPVFFVPDPSELILAPLLLADTGLGYVATVRID